MCEEWFSLLLPPKILDVAYFYWYKPATNYSEWGTISVGQIEGDTKIHISGNNYRKRK